MSASSPRARLLARLSADAGLSAVAAAVGAAVGIVRAGVTTRALGLEGFGLFALAMSTHLLVAKLLSVRVWEWATNELARARADGDEPRLRGVVVVARGITGTLHLVTLGVVWSGADALAALAHAPELPAVLRLASLQSLVLFLDDPATAVLRCEGRHRALAGLSLGGASARTAAAVVCAVYAPTVHGFVVGQVAAQAFVSLATHLAAGRALAIRAPAVAADVRAVLVDRGRHARTLLSLSAMDTLKAALVEADPLLVTSLTGSAAAAGAYRAAFAVVHGMLSLLTPAYLVVQAELAHAVARADVATARALAGRFSLVTAGLVGAVAVPLGLLAPWVMPRLFGPAFEPSIAPTQAMLCGLVLPITGWANPLAVSLGRPGAYLRVVLAMAVVKVTAMVALVPTYGAVGAGLAFSLANVTAFAGGLALVPSLLSTLRARAAAIPRPAP